MSSVPSLRVLHPLTVEEIDQVAEGFKDDLTREGKRCVRRKDLDRALAAFAAEEYVDQFVSVLKLRAGSELGRPKEPKKRIRHIYIPEMIKKPPTRVPLAPEEATEQRHVQEVVAAAGERRQPKHYWIKGPSAFRPARHTPYFRVRLCSGLRVRS